MCMRDCTDMFFFISFFISLHYIYNLYSNGHYIVCHAHAHAHASTNVRKKTNESNLKN